MSEKDEREAQLSGSGAIAQGDASISAGEGATIVKEGFIIHAEKGAQVVVGERYAKKASVDDEKPAPGEAPFKGMQYFDVEDAPLFFGREKLTKRLLAHVNENQFLAVVGASGSGKSSLVRAGVVAALKNEPNWHIRIITPTSRPLETLALSLTSDSESVTASKTLREDMRADSESLHLYARRLLADDSKARLLLVVDQFEELFTLCHDSDERFAFVDNLLKAVSPEIGGPVTVILTLRADFYHYCMQFQPLLLSLEKYQKNIGAMTSEELRSAIEKPAIQAGWKFEPGLVDLMLRDVNEEPGALPLLSHALLATWTRRRGHTLTLAGYSEAGGVRGAIAKTAEDTYRNFNQEEQRIARNIFLRLTELGEGTQDTRRRATLDELKPNSGENVEMESVLQKLADARLITTAKESAEVAHEALIREWSTLRLWLDEDRESLRIHRHLTETAQSWQRRDKDFSELYRGTRLKGVEDWAKEKQNALSPLEKEFLSASQNALKKERRATRLRWAGIAGVLLFALFLGTGWYKRLFYPPPEMAWVEVPAGEFMMGSEGGEDDEQPVHPVYLDAFEIGKYEVTNEEYLQCVRAGFCATPNNQKYMMDEYAQHPVTDVDWYQAKTFCNWVDSKGRLPTEAEWEKAARGGVEGKSYPWGDDSPVCEVGAKNGAQFSNCEGNTISVGSFAPNNYGIYDMAGNVWEWTADWYDENYYASSPASNPLGPDIGDSRVLRGGSWSYLENVLRSAYRSGNLPDYHVYLVGFRCLRSRP